MASSLETIRSSHRVMNWSLNLIGGGGDDMTGSTTFFNVIRVPMALREVLRCLLFDLGVIGRVVVEWVGGEA